MLICSMLTAVSCALLDSSVCHVSLYSGWSYSAICRIQLSGLLLRHHATKSEMGVLFIALMASRASLRIPGGSASQCLICFSRSIVLHVVIVEVRALLLPSGLPGGERKPQGLF